MTADSFFVSRVPEHSLLLLKKGGHVVFHGELGVCSSALISYFENLGATQMRRGENPASWMLNALGEKITVKGESGDDETLDFAKAWKQSSNFSSIQQMLSEVSESPDETKKVQVDSKYAVPWYKRDWLMCRRLVLIYWRSPVYNWARLVLSVVIAVGLGSIFIPQRTMTTFAEADMNGWVCKCAFQLFLILFQED